MTRFLASVRDAVEAGIALAAGADIIDLKEPSAGALGAVARDMVIETVRSVEGRAELSATLGDLPMHPKTIVDALAAREDLGLDYLKLGLFANGDPRGSLAALKHRTGAKRLILVLFADRLPSFDAVAQAADIGAFGVMLDTADKASGSLLDHLSIDAVADFVASAKAKGLLVGLAGSLKAEHVPALLALRPDLLGFRGALCQGRSREGRIDRASVKAIRALIPQAAGRAAKRTTFLPDLPARAL